MAEAFYAEGTIGYDTTFELNEFNEPRLRSEIETLKDTLLFILFSRPGQYPSLPQVGLNIQDYLYEFYDEIDEVELKNKMIEQCETLGIYSKNGSFDIKKVMYKNQPSLIIHIEGTETFPSGYKHDQVGNSKKYMIGLTYNEVKDMIMSINTN